MAKSDATNRKNVKDKNEENSMTDEECAIRAISSTFYEKTTLPFASQIHTNSSAST